MYVMNICDGYWHMTMQGNLTLSAGANKKTWLYIYHFVITYLLQGEFCCRGSYHRLSSSKRGRMLMPTKLIEILMMDKHLVLFYLCCTFWYFCVIFRNLWKALSTHTKYPSKSTWPSNIVDYPLYSRLSKNPSRLDTSKTNDPSLCLFSVMKVSRLDFHI